MHKKPAEIDRTPHNIDAVLAPQLEPDPWDDGGERSEDTGTAGKLTWGPGADGHFATAHAAGAALREQRRQRRGLSSPTVEGDRKPWFDPTGEFDFDSTVEAIRNGRTVDYWDLLAVVKIVTNGPVKRRVVDFDEWREIPGYPGYVMHSISREVWRPPREVTLPNGNVRQYQGKKVTAHNGSYSLTVNGVTSSRGIDVLYRETFPECGKKKRKRTAGEWDDTVNLRTGKTRLEGTEGVPEWLDGGASHAVTRPQ